MLVRTWRAEPIVRSLRYSNRTPVTLKPGGSPPSAALLIPGTLAGSPVELAIDYIGAMDRANAYPRHSYAPTFQSWAGTDAGHRNALVAPRVVFELLGVAGLDSFRPFTAAWLP